MEEADLLEFDVKRERVSDVSDDVRYSFATAESYNVTAQALSLQRSLEVSGATATVMARHPAGWPAGEGDPPARDMNEERINIFTMASGHLYERFATIWMSSVL
eukprot:GABW01000639.1.p1 GENE.GABW01000639.1~~GABW01000639.1.p1  ORF type:complete len:104 (-),score=17.82 GABW01000639.1:23-334(-)